MCLPRMLLFVIFMTSNGQTYARSQRSRPHAAVGSSATPLLAPPPLDRRMKSEELVVAAATSTLRNRGPS